MWDLDFCYKNVTNGVHTTGTENRWALDSPPFETQFIHSVHTSSLVPQSWPKDSRGKILNTFHFFFFCYQSSNMSVTKAEAMRLLFSTVSQGSRHYFVAHWLYWWTSTLVGTAVQLTWINIYSHDRFMCLYKGFQSSFSPGINWSLTNLYGIL